MLAAHGYGVLVFDPRGHGASEGDPNVFGWSGEEDVRSAIRFLQARPDVDPARIGGLGLSVTSTAWPRAPSSTSGASSGSSIARCAERGRRRERPRPCPPIEVLVGAVGDVRVWSCHERGRRRLLP
jgi:alpha-beta hydrolase superfamily lysophospholipase